MALSTPTTAEIADNILGQLETSLSATFPLLPKAFARVLAKALAGVITLLYKYAGWIFLQMFVVTASFRETTVNGRTIRPLIEWGRLIGVGDPLAAVSAELVIEVTVLVQTGELPSGSQLLYSPTGVVYITTSSIALDAATKQVTVRAASDQQGGDGSGDIGNLDPGATLSFASPLANVARDAEVISQAVTGADEESEDAYRTRVIKRFQRKPQGGAYADYQQWGLEAEGVVNIYPYTGTEPGTVTVYVEASEESSGSPDGVPTTAQKNAVRDLINLDQNGLASRRPANAALNMILPITRTAFDIEIVGLDPDTPDTRAAINAAADEYFRSREPFIVGLSILPRRDLITLAGLTAVVEEVASARGAAVVIVKLKLLGSPIPAHSMVQGEKAKLGTSTYV